MMPSDDVWNDGVADKVAGHGDLTIGPALQSMPADSCRRPDDRPVEDGQRHVISPLAPGFNLMHRHLLHAGRTFRRILLKRRWREPR
jgi:hypothetical protein